MYQLQIHKKIYLNENIFFFIFFQENITKIVDLIFENPKSSSLHHGGVIITELAYGSRSDIYDTTTLLNKIPVIFSVLVRSLEKIQKALETSPDDNVTTSLGAVPTFGFCRIQALKIFESLVASRFTCVYEPILKQNLFQTCVNLFFEFQWNNFVHSIVVNACKTLLECNEDEIIQQVRKDKPFLFLFIYFFLFFF